MQNDKLKGVLLVGLGATSYGMLATFVKLAYGEGYTTAEVTASQILLGLAGMFLINLFRKNKNSEDKIQPTAADRLRLIAAGTSIGFTSVFYYISVKYIPVSIAIVMLMQTVWIGVLIEWLLTKTAPSVRKITAVFIVLAGTALATNLIKTTALPDWRGIAWGFLAALSFTGTMLGSNSIATHLSAAQRSLFMLMGGAAVVLIFTAITWPGTFNFDIFIRWGFVLALFGTIVPPLLLNAGFPRTGLGLGSIVSSLELPVSATMAYFILHEQVTALQWLGIALIIGAIVIMNLKTQNGSQIH
jgi:drug/metabolite transporter (DMT)-like permease